MFTRVRQTAALLLLAATANIVTAQNASELKTIGDVSGFMQGYYLHPQPDRIGDVIDALDPTGFLKRPTNANAVIGFFSEVFAANPNHLPEWQRQVAEQDDQTRTTLERALAVSKSGGVLNNSGHSAELNDARWAAFFATEIPSSWTRSLISCGTSTSETTRGSFFPAPRLSGPWHQMPEISRRFVQQLRTQR